MNEIVNKFLLTGNKVMPKTNLRQPGFVYGAFGAFSKNQERIQKSKETGNVQYIYQNELHKACFWLDILYRDFKDLTRRIVSDNKLRNKSFNIAKNLKYNEYQWGLVSSVYNFFNLKSISLADKDENISTKDLTEKLHNLIIWKLQKRKVHSTFMENIWGTDLSDMQLISKSNKRIRFLLLLLILSLNTHRLFL